MRYAINRTYYLLELIRALRRYEGEKDDSRFVEALVRGAENPDSSRTRSFNTLYHRVDLVA
jgi:hypothetical protein